jgi:hypothetical protein
MEGEMVSSDWATMTSLYVPGHSRTGRVMNDVGAVSYPLRATHTNIFCAWLV